MNIVVITGRLTSDPKVREGEKTKVASFRLAVPRPFTRDTADFLSCKAFGKTAEFLENYMHQGDEIAVSGRIETGSYKNKDGNTVYTTDIVCDRVEPTHGAKGGNAEKREEPKKEYSDPSIKQMVDGDLPDSFSQLESDMPF